MTTTAMAVAATRAAYFISDMAVGADRSDTAVDSTNVQAHLNEGILGSDWVDPLTGPHTSLRYVMY